MNKNLLKSLEKYHSEKTQVYSVRLPVSTVEALHKVADKHNTKHQNLVKAVLENLVTEESK
ncbi:hypothetical protein ACNO7T_15730 [Vibrio campbellii]